MIISIKDILKPTGRSHTLRPVLHLSPSAYIKGINVGFRPDAKLIRNLRANYTLKRISSEAMK